MSQLAAVCAVKPNGLVRAALDDKLATPNSEGNISVCRRRGEAYIFRDNLNFIANLEVRDNVVAVAVFVEENIIARAAVERITALVAPERIVARAAINFIVARAAVDCIVLLATGDFICLFIRNDLELVGNFRGVYRDNFIFVVRII